MKYLIGILSLILCYPTIAQDTFFKEIAPHNTSDRLPQSLLIHDDYLYIQSSIICETLMDSFVCMGMAKYDDHCNNIWENTYTWTVSANRRGLKIRNDSLFIGGHRTPRKSRQVYNLLILNTDGDSLFARVHDFSAVLSESGVYSNGIFLTNDFIYTFGMAGLINTEIEVLPIHRYDLKEDRDTLFLYQPEFGNYFPGWDMAEDSDGNLLIFNEIYRIEPFFYEQREIIKIEKNGSLLKRIYGPEPDNSDVNYEFVLMDDGTYTFLNNIPENSNVPVIINTDTSGNILWTVEFPNPSGTDTIGIYEITEMITASNGDIILTGYLNRKKELGDGYDIYLMRVTPEGEVLWERQFNTPVNLSEKIYRYYVPTDVQEYDDGSILVIGVAFHHDDIFLLKVDANGCLDGFDCVDEVLLSNSELPVSNIDNSVSPNPTQGPIEISLPSSLSGQYIIYDLKGRQLGHNSFSNTDILSLDLGRFGGGLYYIYIYGDGFQSRVKVLVNR